MSNAKITVSLDQPIGHINPNIYGHFAEHLGTLHLRWDLGRRGFAHPQHRRVPQRRVAALKKIKPPVIRWPGGCFADDYHWQDGIGPREARPRRINIHWGEVDRNQRGRHAGVRPILPPGRGGALSLRQCRLGQAARAARLGGVLQFSRRQHLGPAARGRRQPEPLNVTYWGVGNENWGCGGNFSPEDYCTEYRRFASFLRGFRAAS